MSVRPVIDRVRVMVMIMVVAVIWAARVAAADRVVEVDVDASTPVTAQDLADALRVRVGDAGVPIRVRVTATIGGVTVSTGTASRSVALGGLAGLDAARLIALAIVDLVDDGSRNMPLAPPGLAVAADPPERPAAQTSFAIAAFGTAAMWSDMLAGVTADVEVAHGSWVGAVDLGAATLVAARLQLREVVVRLVGGVRFGAVELRAGATIMPIDVSSGAGDQTVLVGGGASARLRVPMSAAARFVIAGGIDAFATHTDYTLGATMVSTPWVAPWLAAGIEVSP